ncbi:MAG TPA: sigma factor-like helix-turn-helix DNA-binding protein, partial [Solirubrobacteraceae bacterium]|nr:sigma factor-like helix-turn-helix DNA-binding protein [Solirubrobacteraceae bacterium]
GFNTWRSRGGDPQPDGVTGLHHVALNFSTKARLAEVVGRLVDSGVELRFGLDGGPPRTLDEVAGEVGVSRQRVRRLEQAALVALARRPELRAAA